jgi:hypothetical protein
MSKSHGDHRHPLDVPGLPDLPDPLGPAESARCS